MIPPSHQGELENMRPKQGILFLFKIKKFLQLLQPGADGAHHARANILEECNAHIPIKTQFSNKIFRTLQKQFLHYQIFMHTCRYNSSNESAKMNILPIRVTAYNYTERYQKTFLDHNPSKNHHNQLRDSNIQQSQEKSSQFVVNHIYQISKRSTSQNSGLRDLRPHCRVALSPVLQKVK